MADLGTRTIPSFFIAYLHYRERAIAQDSLTGIKWDWDKLRPSLALPGGPAKKPFYIPFQEPGRGSSNWMNPNAAGSWSPRSTRSGGAARKVILITDESPRGEVQLREDHVRLAAEHLLGDSRVPAISWAVWWLRDYGFTPIPAERQHALVVHAFREMFRFYESGAAANDFATLFDMPATVQLQDWFEPGPQEPQP